MSNKRRQPSKIDKIELLKLVKPLTVGQQNYWNNIEQSTITLCTGLAGTGKDYIAVYLGLKYLLEGKFQKLVITRPIVECGEKLGALPGNIAEKAHPYLRPVLDILLEFIYPEQLEFLIQKEIIDVCPLAYSRGLTFNNAFVCLAKLKIVL